MGTFGPMGVCGPMTSCPGIHLALGTCIQGGQFKWVTINQSGIDTGKDILVAMAIAKPKMFEMWEWSPHAQTKVAFSLCHTFSLRPVYRQIVTSINL